MTGASLVAEAASGTRPSRVRPMVRQRSSRRMVIRGRGNGTTMPGRPPAVDGISGEALTVPFRGTHCRGLRQAGGQVGPDASRKFTPVLAPAAMTIRSSRRLPRTALCAAAVLFSAGLLAPAARAQAAAEPPTSWIDPDTGHRVIRLTREPGSSSFYFNDNSFTPDGKKMALITPGSGIGVLDLTTL